MRVIFLSVCAYMCIVNAAKFCSSNSNSQDLSQHHKSVMYQLYLPYISHLALGMGGKKPPTFPTCYHSVNLLNEPMRLHHLATHPCNQNRHLQ